MAEETAASLLLHQLKIVSLNTKAVSSVASQLDAVLVTETGTETSGSVTISGEEYLFLVDMFVQSLETNLVRMLCEAISEDAMEATSSGTMEMSLEELNELVMEFFDLISQDFLSSESSGGESTYANDLAIKIQSAKLTVALTENELTMVEFIVGRLVNLEGELEGTIHVFLFQYQLITGNSLEIQVNEVPCELPSMMMTTMNPGSMMTTKSSMMMTTKSSQAMMTTKSHAMMTTARPSMMTTGSMMMMTTKSSGFVTNEMVEIDVEVCVRGEARAAPWARFGYSSKRREWLKNAMKNAFKKHF